MAENHTFDRPGRCSRSRDRGPGARLPFVVPRLGEQTDHPQEVIEAAAAHVGQNKVEAAHARSDLFERRRRLMDGGLPRRKAPGGGLSAVTVVGGDALAVLGARPPRVRSRTAVNPLRGSSSDAGAANLAGSTCSTRQRTRT